MKRRAAPATVAAPCTASLAPAQAQGLSGNREKALAAMIFVGLGVALAARGKGHNSTTNWVEDRFGEAFSRGPGVVCLPRPRQCHQGGAISWRWTQRIFG